jgi:tetratricopeptide (TPR) repeat protein
MTRRLLPARTGLVAALLFLGPPERALAQPSPPSPATLDWQVLQSRDLTIVGAVPEDTLKHVAFLLRRFREAIEPVLPAATRPPLKPTTVIVFPQRQQMAQFATGTFSEDSYQAGLFVGGATSNFILVTTADDDFSSAYHEFVHLLLHQQVNAPAWFHEGLAEFFRTFTIADGGRPYIGSISTSHVNLLRAQGLMPLSRLMEAGFDSPLYQGHDQRSVFYAQSWLLVHYLLLSDERRRAEQLLSFVAQLIDGIAPEQASLNAFNIGLSVLDEELRRYVGLDTFPRHKLPGFIRRPTTDDSPPRPLAVSHAHTLLGEVFLELHRYSDAQREFEAALLAEPDAPRAHAGLGLLLVQQARNAEARVHLERAVKAPDANWATLVSYASALSSLRPAARVDTPAPDDIAMEQALRRAIALEPARPIAHATLAQLLSLRSDRVAEAQELIHTALKMAPADEQVQLLSAIVLMNSADYASARPRLEALTRAMNSTVRQQAKELLTQAVAVLSTTAGRTARDAGLTPPALAPRTDVLMLFRPLRDGERRSSGWLTSIDCRPNGLTVVVRTATETLRFSARSLHSIELISYRQQRTSVQCGAGLQGAVIVASYVADATKGINGRITALEFAPDGYMPTGTDAHAASQEPPGKPRTPGIK